MKTDNLIEFGKGNGLSPRDELIDWKSRLIDVTIKLFGLNSEFFLVEANWAFFSILYKDFKMIIILMKSLVQLSNYLIIKLMSL